MKNLNFLPETCLRQFLLMMDKIFLFTQMDKAKVTYTSERQICILKLWFRYYLLTQKNFERQRRPLKLTNRPYKMHTTQCFAAAADTGIVLVLSSSQKWNGRNASSSPLICLWDSSPASPLAWLPACPPPPNHPPTSKRILKSISQKWYHVRVVTYVFWLSIFTTSTWLHHF